MNKPREPQPVSRATEHAPVFSHKGRRTRKGNLSPEQEAAHQEQTPRPLSKKEAPKDKSHH